MRGACLVVVVVGGVMGCATLGPSGGAAKAEAAKTPPGKNEVVVIGRGPEPIPGGVSPKDQGTEYVVSGRQTYRCTKADDKKEARRGTTQDELEFCRGLNTGEGRNPDPGRVVRSKTQGGAK